MKKKKGAAILVAVLLVVTTLLSSCAIHGGKGTDKNYDEEIVGGRGGTIRILSGSENKELVPILKEYADQAKIEIDLDYKGSVDIMRALQEEEVDYDAVWPASSMWITAGDSAHRVKHAESISITPVIFGIRKSLAESLGFVGTTVKVADILDAIRSGRLKFCMTSATQSNSGCSAYIGFLYALLGNPDMITAEQLESPELKTDIADLLSGVDRSSGSSDWLKELFLEGDFDAMVNYECLIISANQELEKQGREPLYAVYPEDGLSLADSPLGYVDHGDENEEKLFLAFQQYLLSDEVQNKIQRTGRRTGYTQKVSSDNLDVFKTEWGLQPDRVLSPFNMPSLDVLMEALNLYQTSFRKPSLTVYCLDYSGSMAGTGRQQLIEAMDQLLDQDKAAENFLQASPDDVNIVIPFDSMARTVLTANGNGSDLFTLQEEIESEDANGGTNIYEAARTAVSALSSYDISQYTTAIILLTDGRSQNDYQSFAAFYQEEGQGVPIFSITFGDAEDSQLQQLAELSKARVFDGKNDLSAAFRKAKGYN